MKKHQSQIRLFFVFISGLVLFAGCTAQIPQTVDNSPSALPVKTIEVFTKESPIKNTSKPESYVPPKIWIAPELRGHASISAIGDLSLEMIEEKEKANFWLTREADNKDLSVLIYEKIFVVAVQFTYARENITLAELSRIWESGLSSAEMSIWIDMEDLDDLQIILGKVPGKNVNINQEIPESCTMDNCLRILPFEKLTLDWQLILLDDQSPFNQDFRRTDYPLADRVYIVQNLPKSDRLEMIEGVEVITNFNPDLLTSVLLTGTTALVRNTAYQMETNGIDFPIQNISNLVEKFDIVHVSNEVPFYSDCPPAVPVRKEMRFCSDPGYIDLLSQLHVNVIELTGNHLLDWGPEAFFETIDLYEDKGFLTYGGGRTIEDALDPALFIHNQNKIAFLGCNLTGPENNFVSEGRPGALKCDLELMEELVSKLRANGYNPIFTFQHKEFNTFRATNQMQEDFWRIANAGAVIVSGSQAHYPQGIEIVNGSFIHYGLGNFLFDQMYSYWAMATIDAHYFYNNQYINSRLIPIINENYGQPRLMTEEETERLFTKIYEYSLFYQRSEQ